MEAVLGTSLPVFIGVTIILFGSAAFMMGQALAQTWRPVWQNIVYGAFLAAGDRFITFALFGGDGLSIAGYLASAAILVAISLFAYRATAVRKMAMQYPWLYELDGVLSYREKRQ